MSKKKINVSSRELLLSHSQPVYMVLDSRALTYALGPGEYDLTNHEDWGKFIILAGENAYSACRECNGGSYGDLCIPVDEEGNVMWSWYRGDWKWEPDMEFPTEEQYLVSIKRIIEDYNTHCVKVFGRDFNNN